jgi:hypothetical protein
MIKLGGGPSSPFAPVELDKFVRFMDVPSNTDPLRV